MSTGITGFGSTGKGCARLWKSFLKYAPGVMGIAIHDNSRGADEFGRYGTEKCKSGGSRGIR